MYSQNRNRTVVIGGGLAGLSAAWNAARAGQDVVVLERSPYLGGRCMSIYDNGSQRWIDNCPHVFLECCTGSFESVLTWSQNEWVKVGAAKYP